MTYSARIDEALRFAARMHDGQRRKGTDIPYIVHPVAVGLMLQRFGFDDDVVAAGILHDVLEDTDCTLDELRARFGAHVAEWVRAVSEPDKSLSWEVRKQQAVERMRTMSFEAKAIACADKAHNLHTIADALALGEVDVWARFHRGRDLQLGYHRAAVAALSVAFAHPIVSEVLRALERVDNGAR
ncbi:MAG: HD domain-containing protein [Myxococcota bacterium]